MSTLMPTEPDISAADTPEPADQHRALYRRWRAQRFRELLGQDPIVATLRRAVAADRTAHAYLFVGPRGTGKTSTARILAKAINCTNRDADGEPCDSCAACVAIREGRALDVIEIDAASHGLVEDARDLVMRALTAPAELRRRVYIIDEVHMLSAHAFNALLKMVEEPPDHVVFILATTDTHKVPATIISRTQRFDFRRLPADTIVGKLTRITSAEGAEADADALQLIARLADGGMRDAESLLDQVLAYAGDRVTADAVREAVGLADDEAIAALLSAYLRGDAPAALDRIEALADGGRDMAQVAAQAETAARAQLLASAGEPATARRLATILRTLAEAAAAGAREGRSRLAMELLAVEPAAESVRPIPVAAPATGSAAAAPSPVEPKAATPPKPVAEAPAKVPPPAAEPEPKPRPAPQPVGAAPIPEDVAALRGRWAEVVAHASPAIKPLLSECRPVSIDGARLTLAFPEERGFMREKARNRSAAIEQLLGSVLGGSWAVDCVASNVELEPLTVQQAVAADPADTEGQALLDSVLRVTGGELIDAPEVR
ncbi:MAG TPA: DNA polymerase III subunit gamma/tau [Candidatus Limnocylindria bacterium]|nr:DNA polymerase III subunit gamma/tau [Candidatus Limnocylindria bacterium]